MPAHIPISQKFRAKAQILAEEMASWESKPRLDAATEENIRKNIRPFSIPTQLMISASLVWMEAVTTRVFPMPTHSSMWPLRQERFFGPTRCMG